MSTAASLRHPSGEGASRAQRVHLAASGWVSAAAGGRTGCLRAGAFRLRCGASHSDLERLPRCGGAPKGRERSGAVGRLRSPAHRGRVHNVGQVRRRIGRTGRRSSERPVAAAHCRRPPRGSDGRVEALAHARDRAVAVRVPKDPDRSFQGWSTWVVRSSDFGHVGRAPERKPQSSLSSASKRRGRLSGLETALGKRAGG